MIRRMRFACRISKDTGTHSEYVMPIAFERKKQWLRERASTYIACLFNFMDRLANERVKWNNSVA